MRAFLVSIAALAVALLLALYSGAAAENGQRVVAGLAAISALVLAAWVAITLVPIIARRTALRWIGHKIEYKVTREGWFYLAGVMAVAVAGLNTGNNLLFLILASMIALILMSGILSTIGLSGISMRLELPEEIFAGETVHARMELRNDKQSMPSFSLRVEGIRGKDSASSAIMDAPVYFPYTPRQERVHQWVPLVFPRRGLYRQEAFRIATRFPFGFLEKGRRVDLAREVLVYPSIAATQDFRAVLPALQGSIESLNKGRGQDLHALRDYRPTDSARHVHWKASARTGTLLVREFNREDDRRVLLVFDPSLPANLPDAEAKFERAVELCASIAWYFQETNAMLRFRTAGSETPLAPAGEIITDVLRLLALSEPAAQTRRSELLDSLGGDAELSKIVLTSHDRGTIPDDLWHSAYFVFLPDL
ncbi:MAG TPA: DUF58 domain-containing protein [Methylomirabilota bacterium]|nr:DUF58 domain-containing protein [Methylomirabilota bacterium]